MASRIDPGLRREIAKLGARDLGACMNCGFCTATCALSTETEIFPRRIVHLLQVGNRDRLAASGRCAPTLSRWLGATLHAACFTAEVAGTTGAGDCTIAGLLAALVRGEGPRDALRAAVATGSASVERPDATSGIPDWSVLADRLARGWPRDPALPFPHSV